MGPLLPGKWGSSQRQDYFCTYFINCINTSPFYLMYTANLNVPLTWSLFAKLPHSGPRVTQLHRFQSCKTSLPPSSAGAGPLWQDSKLLITIAQSWVTWYLSEMPGKLCFPFYTNIIMSFPQTLLAYQLLGGAAIGVVEVAQGTEYVLYCASVRTWGWSLRSHQTQ